MRTFFVAFICVVGWSVEAADPTRILPPQKPSDTLFKEVLAARNFSLQPERWEWTFDAMEARGQLHDESPGVWMTDCSCKGDYTLAGATLRFTCRASCTKAWSAMSGPPKRSQVWLETIPVTLRFVYLSPELTLFVHDSKRWISAPCSPPHSNNPRCSQTQPTSQLLVQLIPGAKDTALFDAVKTEIAKSSAADRLVFEGTPASKPREVSEVLFTSGNEAEAKKLAAALEPVIGRVEVKPWPGEWDFGVVVVVGAKKAP